MPMAAALEAVLGGNQPQRFINHCSFQANYFPLGKRKLSTQKGKKV